jgi:hypothetical protein
MADQIVFLIESDIGVSRVVIADQIGDDGSEGAVMNRVGPGVGIGDDQGVGLALGRQEAPQDQGGKHPDQPAMTGEGSAGEATDPATATEAGQPAPPAEPGSQDLHRADCLQRLEQSLVIGLFRTDNEKASKFVRRPG